MKKISSFFEIKNKVSVITGASGNLGSVICETLAELGSDLILIDNNSTKKNLRNFSNKLKKKYTYQKFYFFNCNFESRKQKLNLFKKLNKFKKIDVLINNAGYNGPKNGKGYLENFEKQDLGVWNNCVEVNLTSIFELSQAILPALKKSKSASIINIGSIYGVYAPDWTIYKGTKLSNPAAYAASKGGLIQLTKWMSKSMGSNVRVNAISPGGILRKQSKKFVNAYKEKTSLKRMATEKDFVGIIALLSSNASSYITGQNIIVDGGWGT